MDVETTAIIGYKVYSDWRISRNPHSTEWMKQYSEKMAGPIGRVPSGTFDKAFPELSVSDVERIRSLEKGSRPDPAEYLSDSYIQNHLSQFNDGASIIMTRDAYETYVQGNDFIGYPDNTQFIMPKAYCDQIMNSASNTAILEERLGFEPGHFATNGGIVRIDITDISHLNLRISSGNELGANEFWIPGGFTSGGTPEAIVDRIPISDVTITTPDIGGM